MNRQESDADDLQHAQDAVTKTNAKLARALIQASDLQTTPLPAQALWSTHHELLKTHRALRAAIDTVERTLADTDTSRTTPKQITSDHADRLAETYDGPVANLALMLAGHNRVEWLHEKPNTHGAETVERHGLTENQRSWLNDLQDAWRAKDHVYDPRTIDDDRVADHLQTIITEARNENWGNVRVNLETALERVEELEGADSE